MDYCLEEFDIFTFKVKFKNIELLVSTYTYKKD